MGNSSSNTDVTQTFENKVYNRDTLNLANTYINEQIVNLTVDSVKKCSSSTIAEQNITITGIRTGGDFIFDTNQTANIVVDFSCIQKDSVKNEIANKIINEINGKLKTEMNTDLINEITATAESKAKDDSLSLPWGGSSSDSDVNQTIKNNIVNVQEKNISNVIKAVTDLNFSQKFYDECINRVIAKQDVKLSDIEAGGNVTINIDQKLLINTFTKCVQNAQVGTKILEDFAYITGFDVEGGFKSTADSAAKGEAEAISETTGLSNFIESFGTAIGNFFSSLFGGLLPFSSTSSSILSSSLLCCCLIFIIFGISAWYLFKKNRSNLIE